ncbi:MAG: transcription antitermination factor NusB [Candidatus Omnitrophica bacterium]|nr:transcription antitermination factor NusB [Candidatus Omnitrophota bacterium]
MRKRTKAREFALQILYQMDISQDSYEVSLGNFWQAQAKENIEEEVKNFTSQLVKGVRGNLEKIDLKISQYATNWQLSRIAVVDKNILRLGSFELMFCHDIPLKVSINEAVELAKKYSSLEASKFVNGILDKVKLERKTDEIC